MTLLSDIKVLDLTRILAGPWATQCLADFGATIWKIETPLGGDDTREWGPPWFENAAGRDTRESAYYLSANRGKRSVAIDISTPEGQELVRRLAARADVLVENFPAGTLARYALTYEHLQPLNPRLVYCSILPDEHSIAEPPQEAGAAASHMMTGMYAVSAIIAALYERKRSGAGQHIDLALLDTHVAMLAHQNFSYLLSARVPAGNGTAQPGFAPYQVFATTDSYLMLAVTNDRQFAAFCAGVGRAEWAQDERYCTNALRVENRASLVAQIEKVCREKSTHQWLQLLRPAGVPCGPVSDLAQMLDEPEVQDRGLRIDLPHPLCGSVPQIRNPVRFMRTPVQYRAPPPLLGQHTDEVLTDELGLTLREIAALSMRAVIN
jgi:crotonobetainyl-CoA:carnitine CoA-transferase CaiB-like acyl-CoA transferase